MNTIIKTFLIVLSIWVTTVLHAKPLSPKVAFKTAVTAVDNSTITLKIDMPKDYYVYRETRFEVTGVDDGLVIKDVALSPGAVKNDKFFGEQSIWYGGKHDALISIMYDNPQALTSTQIKLKFQGCQNGVICYPPQQREMAVDLPEVASSPISGHLLNQPTAITPVLASQSIHSTAKDSLLTINKKDVLLSEDEAFPFTVEPIDATTLALRFNVADGYYLYRDKTQITATDATNQDAESPIADIVFRDGDIHSDEFYGEQVIYRADNVIANIYLKRPVSDLSLKLQFQGCAEKGICYPVMNREVRLENGFVSYVNNANAPIKQSAVEQLASTLKNNWWAGVGLLLLAGIALSLTPCVLPMLPILLGIITNQRKVSKPRAFMLSSAYGLGVAMMMAVFGLVVAKTGINIQIIFQQPLWLILFASIFIAMGLAMLGVFNIAMPSNVQTKVINWQNKFQDTNAFSMLVVGALSTLIVGPCVAPPLIAVLVFISTTGDSLLGALYLFALGAGMSMPLIIFASFVPSIPKTGALSRLVTRIFAMLMFGVGLWLLARLLPGSISLMLWGGFVLVLAWLFWKSGFIKPYAQKIAKVFSISFVSIGCIWIIGGIMGSSNPLKPFIKITHLPFIYVNSISELKEAIGKSDKPVLVDLYADWCVSCQEVEHFTLTDAAVIDKTKDFTLLKIDISDTNDTHRKLLSEYDLIGPPVMLFFDKAKERVDLRHVGAIKAKTLVDKLNQMQP